MADQFYPVPLEDIPSFLMDPDDEDSICYIGTLDDTMRHLAAAGETDYYIMAIEKKTVTNGNNSTVTRHPQIFYVTETLAYRSVTPIGLADLPYEEITSTAFFSLPKIPISLMNWMDDLFRTVDRKLGTESIVILTFDETCVDEDGNYTRDGWGVLIPDQSNTGAHCDYEPQSVAGTYPDHVTIVGTVHSHPNMPAFASGTDSHDQAAFDGLHITFGWQKSVNNGATQYHCELQIDGTGWRLQPEQVFEDRPPREVSEGIEEVIEAKIKKKSYQSSSTYSQTGGTRGITDRIGTGTSSGAHHSGTSLRRSLRLEDLKGLPANAPSADENTLVGLLKSQDEISCPFCRQPLISQDRTKRRCTACHSYLGMPGESVADVLEARNEENVMTWDLDIAEEPPKPIILWNRDGTPEFETIYSPASSGKE